MKKWICLLLALLLLTGCAQNGAGSNGAELQWEFGSISSKTGKDRAVEEGTSLRTVNYVDVADCAGILPDTHLSINWFAYDEQKGFVGSGVTALGNGIGISTAEILETCPNAAYLRLTVRSAYKTGTVEVGYGQYVHVFSKAEGWPGLPMEREEIANISGHQGKYLQDGEAWGDHLFVFKDDGTANVYDVETGQLLDGFLLGGRDKIIPHVNSASFSDQYYAEGDAYPLLYTSMYNNLFEGKELYGTCCVYRITELGGQFDAQLVQVIRIAFTSDRELWLSEKINDRPYGNFVVDTDRDMFYAFVPRDDSRTTRFFGFALPTPDAGTYNEGFGCNLVRLLPEDVVRQFDVGYFSSPQGCCYADGKIYSVEGFGTATNVPPFLRVVDVESGTLEKSVNLGQLGLDREPEVITSSGGELYYISTDVILNRLWFPES